MIQIEARSIKALIPYARNARTHSADQVAQIAGSIAEFGFVNPVLIGSDGGIIAGHGRVMAAEKLGMSEVPVVVLSHLDEDQRRALIIADNKIAENAGWDEGLLRLELSELQAAQFDVDLLGFSEADVSRLLDGIDADLGGSGPAAQESAPGDGDQVRATLSERFGIPPFSVFEARRGWWQDRKRAWLALGIRSELGRGEGVTYEAEQITEPGLNYYRNRNNAAPGGSPRPLDRGWTGKKASPGGAPLPSASYSKDGARGNGRGKALV